MLMGALRTQAQAVADRSSISSSSSSLFPGATVTDYHEPGGLKKHQGSIILQFYRSEVQDQGGSRASCDCGSQEPLCPMPIPWPWVLLKSLLPLGFKTFHSTLCHHCHRPSLWRFFSQHYANCTKGLPFGGAEVVVTAFAAQA